jgi:SNF2 family DNA or RNA helicase
MLTVGFTRLNSTPVFIVPIAIIDENLAQRVFGATCLETKGIWAFPAFPPFIDDVTRDLDIIAGDKENLEFNQAAKEYLDSLTQLPTSLVRSDFVYVTKPFEHQKSGLEFVLRNLRSALFFDCGLGKSKIVIDLLRHERKKTLILAPVTVLKVWQKEISIHALPNEFRVVALQAASRAKKQAILQQANQAGDVLLVSYDSAPRYFEDIMKNFPFEIIIADESHAFRNPSSKRTKCGLALASRAARRIILSGTPTLGNPMHLYGQLAFLGKYIPATSYWVYRKRYLVFAPHDKLKRMIVGYKNLDLLNAKVQKLAIRRTKEECLDLPDRTIIDMPFEVSRDQRLQYNKLIETYELESSDGKVVTLAHAAVVLQKLLQILSGFYIMPHPAVCDSCPNVAQCVDEKVKPYTKLCAYHPNAPDQKIQHFKANGKLEAFTELLDGILQEETNKVIVWCYFKEELALVQAYLEEQKIGYVRVDGSNSSKAQALADQLGRDPSLRVYLGQISTGVGITVTSAAYMIYYGLSYSLDAYLQSLDRNYRIGQAQKVFVYRLIANGSVLEYVAAALSAKIDLANTLTTAIRCATCPQGLTCMTKNIKPFTQECLYQNKVGRVVTKFKLLDAPKDKETETEE